MSTIVTRAGKGSALTWTEGDANITNLNNDKLEDITGESIGDLSDVSVTTPSDGQVLTYMASGQWENQTPSSGATQLNQLTDVDSSLAPTEGQVLAWNNSLMRFESSTPFDGAYSSLSGTPSIPSDTGDLTNGAGFITSANVVDDTTPQLGGALDAQGNVISNPVLKDYAETIYAIGSNDNPTITVSNGNVQSVTITAGLALPAFADAAAGQSVTLLVSGTGSATGTGAYVFAGGAKTLTTSSVVSIFYDGTTYWTSIATDFQA